MQHTNIKIDLEAREQLQSPKVKFAKSLFVYMSARKAAPKQNKSKV